MKLPSLPSGKFEDALSKGAAVGETLIAAIFIFIIVAAVLYFVDIDYFSKVIKDVTLRVAMNRVVSEVKSFAVSNNGRFPTCVEVAGVGKGCEKALINNVVSCKCPVFKVKDVFTGAEPFEGFKYLSKEPASFCLVAPLNNTKKGTFLRYKHGVDSSPVETRSTCD